MELSHLMTFTVNKSGRLEYGHHEWLSAVWSFCFFRKTSSKRAIGGRSISWRVAEYGDSWERNRGESVYLEGFCRSRARVGVSNRIRDPGSSYLKRCRQDIIIFYGSVSGEISSSWALGELRPQGWNLKELTEGHTRGGACGLIWINTGKLTRTRCFLWLTGSRSFRIWFLVVHGRWWCVGWPV